MLKKKLWFKILVIVLLLIFCNLVYYLSTSWQDIFPSLSPQPKVSLKTFSSTKIGIELKYPEFWILKDSGEQVEINPPSNEDVTYFSAGLRSDFKSLDDIKKTLAADVPTTPVQIDSATGFEYTDSDYHEIIWLLHSGKIYLFRTYFSPSSNDRTADKILATVKFTD